MPRFNAFRSKPDQADDKASAHERRFACRQWSLPFARLLNRTRATCLRRAVLSPFVPAKAGTQALALDSRLRGNERSLLLSPFVPAESGDPGVRSRGPWIPSYAGMNGITFRKFER